MDHAPVRTTNNKLECDTSPRCAQCRKLKVPGPGCYAPEVIGCSGVSGPALDAVKGRSLEVGRLSSYGGFLTGSIEEDKNRSEWRRR